MTTEQGMPADVYRQIIELQEQNAWLEGKMLDLLSSFESLKVRVDGQGRRLHRLGQIVEGENRGG